MWTVESFRYFLANSLHTNPSSVELSSARDWYNKNKNSFSYQEEQKIESSIDILLTRIEKDIKAAEVQVNSPTEIGEILIEEITPVKPARKPRTRKSKAE